MNSIFESMIGARSPTLSQIVVADLAEIWSAQLSRILDRVTALTHDSGRVTWHVDARAEAVGEMAKLTNWLAIRIVDERTKDRPISAIDPVIEASELTGSSARTLVENTAHIVAERIWFKVYDRLQRAYPLVVTPSQSEWPPRLGNATFRQEQPRTVRNHYIPAFTVSPWANAEGRVRIFSRKNRLIVSARTGTPTSWGYETFLYDQALEDWFAQIESRAASPYITVQRMLPLGPDARYFWITFLISQFLRTPHFIARLARGMKFLAARERWPWSMTPELLRRAYSTLFDDDRVFARYYRRINERRWQLYEGAPGLSFPRTDSPIATTSMAGRRGWAWFYPLSPTQCFAVGPDLGHARDVPAALAITLGPGEMRTLNDLLLRSSRRSFVTRVSDSDDDWKTLATQLLPSSDPIEGYRAWGRFE